jgi:NAD(P)-dependent dehydrogenase (short-subunit alcohol dehydrogenase family)
VVAEIAQVWGPVGVLVNNAGIGGRAGLESEDLAEDLDRVMAVNVKGLMNLTQACTEGLKQTRGAVVNVASITTLVATRANIAYGASKGRCGAVDPVPGARLRAFRRAGECRGARPGDDAAD